MTKEIDPRDIRIDRRDKPAGGRGAVKSTFDAFREQGIPFKAVSSLLLANKPKQFDCPGCAFPDKPGSPPFDSCEQGQKAIAWEMTRKAAAPDFFARHTIEQLRALSDHELELQGRLTTPMLYTAATGTYTAIGWQQAFDIAGAELRAIEPEQVAFYASGRSSNKAAFLWQLAARAYGCPNLPDSSNFCHEPSGFALKAATGVSKGTCSLEDFKHAELIMVIGQNPATNHPRMMTALRDAALRGTKVVAINPLRERGFTNCSDPKSVGEMLTGTGRAVAHRIYQVRIGGDLALFKGVMKRLLEMDSQARASGGARMLDERFIGDHTLGFDALARDMAAEPRDRLVAESGVNRDMINELAELYAGSRATMATWCMGLTHHASRITHHASRITHHASRITHHASREQCRYDSDADQSAASQGQHRAPRRRRRAGARSQQRARRSHHGRHLGRVGALVGQYGRRISARTIHAHRRTRRQRCDPRAARRRKAVRHDIPAGCAAAYFPEASPLLPVSLASLHTQTPAYKEIPVMISPAV